MNIFCTYEGIPIDEMYRKTIDAKKYEKLICIDEARNAANIDELVKLHKPDIVFIDYAQ